MCAATCSDQLNIDDDDNDNMRQFENIISPHETLTRIINDNTKIDGGSNADDYSSLIEANLDAYFIPTTKAVGLNGCLSENGDYYPFTDPMPCISSQLIISPYIIIKK